MITVNVPIWKSQTSQKFCMRDMYRGGLGEGVLWVLEAQPYECDIRVPCITKKPSRNICLFLSFTSSLWAWLLVFVGVALSFPTHTSSIPFM